MTRFVLLTLLALSTAGCALETATSGRIAVGEGSSRAEAHFSPRDRAVIEDYYQDRLPPGLAKRHRLPPGLARHERLPPGLRTQRLPASLEERLTPLPARYSRLHVDGAVVLLDRDTRVVLDVVALNP